MASIFDKLFGNGPKSIADLYARFYHDEQKIFVDWGINNCGFGSSLFFVENGVMYCDSEYMSKETEALILKAVYEKYGKPEWAMDTFVHGHRYISDMGPPIVNTFEKFGDG